METIEKSKLDVRIIDPNELPDLWPLLEPLVAEACRWSNGQSSIRSVVDGVISGHYRLTVFFNDHIPQSILVLTVSQFPTGRRLMEVLLASGSAMRDWMPKEGELIAYAKSLGCHAIRMIGRDGLQKHLSQWKRTAVVLEREIE